MLKENLEMSLFNYNPIMFFYSDNDSIIWGLFYHIIIILVITKFPLNKKHLFFKLQNWYGFFFSPSVPKVQS